MGNRNDERESQREFDQHEAVLAYERRLQERELAKEAKRKRDAERSAAEIVDAVMDVDR
jgi:hypothetical protein